MLAVKREQVHLFQGCFCFLITLTMKGSTGKEMVLPEGRFCIVSIERFFGFVLFFSSLNCLGKTSSVTKFGVCYLCQHLRAVPAK